MFGQQAGPAQGSYLPALCAPLCSAAWKNNPEVARMLLLHPTMDSANAKDNGGDTAVMWAVGEGLTEILSELVAHRSVSLDIGNVGEIRR